MHTNYGSCLKIIQYLCSSHISTQQSKNDIQAKRMIKKKKNMREFQPMASILDNSFLSSD